MKDKYIVCLCRVCKDELDERRMSENVFPDIPWSDIVIVTVPAVECDHNAIEGYNKRVKERNAEYLESHLIMSMGGTVKDAVNKSGLREALRVSLKAGTK